MNEKTARIGNRMFGLARIVLAGVIMNEGGIAIPLGGVFAIEGLGDLISGDHHYSSSRIIYYLSNKKIKIEYPFNRQIK